MKGSTALTIAVAGGLMVLACPAKSLAQKPAKPLPPRIATLNLEQAPLRSALEFIFGSAGVQYTVAPNVPNVPVSAKLRDVRWDFALELVIRQAATAVPGLAYTKTGDVYAVEIRPKPGAHGPTINLSLKEAPLRDALEAIFGDTGVTYSVTADVRNTAITVNLRDIPLDEAVRMVVSQALAVQPELVVMKSGRGYTFETHPLTDGHRAPETEARLYRLMFRSADQVEGVLRTEVASDGLGSVVPTQDGRALLVRATAEGLKRADQLLRELDVPRRSLSLRVAVTAVEAGAKPLHYGGTANTLDGQPLIIEESVPLQGRPAHIRVRIEPTALGNEGFQVTSDWDISLPLMAAGHRPLRLAKKLTSTTVISPGKPVEIASADLSAWGIPGKVRFWLCAEAIPRQR